MKNIFPYCKTNLYSALNISDVVQFIPVFAGMFANGHGHLPQFNDFSIKSIDSHYAESCGPATTKHMKKCSFLKTW